MMLKLFFKTNFLKQIIFSVNIILFKDQEQSKVFIKILLTPMMRVLAYVSAHAGPSTQPPIDMSENFLAPMSAESPLNISPNPSEVISEVLELYDKSF